METGRGSALSETARYFTRLGFIAFGGPAAHIAIMRRELVVERRWMDDAAFADLLGVANLVPGPNSTEMAMYAGSRRAGVAGLWLAGLGFIVPAVCIVLALAWGYVRYGDTPPVEGLLTGVQPVVLTIIAQAIWGLRRAGLRSPVSAMLAALVAGLALIGVPELVLLLGSGLLMLALGPLLRSRPSWEAVRHAIAGVGARGRAVVPAIAGGPAGLLTLATAVRESSLGELFLVFLKIGGLLYGSGYVLVSFMRADFVESRGWLSEQQLLDAIAAGQFTPGPLFTSATFAGYVIDGLPGALVATAGIFLPSFLFVQLTAPLVPRLRNSRWAGPFLDGVNAAALALMAVVVVGLARELDGVFQFALLGVAAVVLLRFSPNSAWLVLGGAAAGLAYRTVT